MDFLKFDYCIKDNIDIEYLINKKELYHKNHYDVNGFWKFSNNLAMYYFSKNKYNYKEIIDSKLCNFCAPHSDIINADYQ